MKRILFAAAALITLAGCQKDEVATPSGTMPQVITASFEQAGGSRVAVDNDGKLTWTAEDSFYLFDGNDNSKKDQYVIKSEDVGQATASFTLQGESQVSAVAYGVFPVTANPTISGTKVQMNLTNDMKALPMLAKTSSVENISFKHLCAALRINFSEIPEGYNTVIVEASNPICGTFEADLDATEPVLTAVEDATDLETSVVAKSWTSGSTAEVVDLALPVGTYASLVVKLAKDEDGTEAQILKSWSNLEVKRAKLYTTSASGQVVDLSQMPIAKEEQVAAVAEAFTEALANPEVEEIKLPENVQLPMTQPITFAVPTASAAASASRAETAVTLAARDITIDGNRATLVYEGASGSHVIDVKKETAGMNLTLKNLTIENQTAYIERGVNYNTNGKLTLDNVTIKSAENCAITYAVSLPSSSDNAMVEITNSDICGRIALNLWGENTKVTITGSDLSNFDDNADEGYSTIVLNNDGTNAATGSTIIVTGGSISATDENGNPSIALQNACIATEVSISQETNVTGKILNAVAVVLYTNTNNYYSSFSLQSAVTTASETAGCTVKLILPITLTESVEVPAEANFTLDLNGQTITNTAGDTPIDIFYIEEDANLVLTGEGTVQTVDNNEGYPIFCCGSLTIEGGTYVGSTDQNGEANAVIYAKHNGQIKITGGEFKTTATDKRYVLNCYDESYNAGTANISVMGGKFYDFNPENNLAEGEGTNFMAEGYEAVEENGVWTVVEKTAYEIASAADLAEFAAEIASGNNFAGESVKLTQDITLTEEFTPIAPGTRSGRNAVGTGFAGIFDGGGEYDRRLDDHQR